MKVSESGVNPVQSSLCRLTLGVGLFLFWLLLSNQFNPVLLALGVLSSALVVFVAMRMDVLDREGVPIQLGFRVLSYWFWLTWKVTRASLSVARLICRRSIYRCPGAICPVTASIPCSQQSYLGLATYANSITLTPGTVTILLESDQLEIHALTREAWLELEQQEMDQRVTHLEGMKKC